MKHIDKFILKSKMEDHGIEPFELVFQDGLNLIVGENGCGKSTLLYLLTHNEYRKENTDSEINVTDENNEVGFYLFDAEKDNPRAKESVEYSKNIEWDLMSRFLSHGETLLPMIKAITQPENSIILLDEPESGISLGNQKKTLGYINQAVENNNQIIIATHSYILIKNTPKVYDMTRGKWVKSSTYLKQFE